MATIFQRISLIVKSNVNELLDRFEDPEKIIDQCIIDAKEEYSTLLKDTASVKGNLSVAREKLKKIQDSRAQWQSIAEKAVKAGNDNDARKALQKMTEDKAQEESQAIVVAKCEEAADKAVAALNSFADQIHGDEKVRVKIQSHRRQKPGEGQRYQVQKYGGKP